MGVDLAGVDANKSCNYMNKITPIFERRFFHIFCCPCEAMRFQLGVSRNLGERLGA